MLQCQVPGCNKQTYEAELQLAIRQLSLHIMMVHGMGDVVEDTALNQYKKTKPGKSPKLCKFCGATKTHKNRKKKEASTPSDLTDANQQPRRWSTR